MKVRICEIPTFFNIKAGSLNYLCEGDWEREGERESEKF
jgi:hypothetical protein